jgi:hypothetical protein
MWTMGVALAHTARLYWVERDGLSRIIAIKLLHVPPRPANDLRKSRLLYADGCMEPDHTNSHAGYQTKRCSRSQACRLVFIPWRLATCASRNSVKPANPRQTIDHLAMHSPMAGRMIHLEK